ncbi:hypothetical protein A3C57_00685 [Candidatus Nomurabacteria bacterium RIFCSPHIGHO2_02_FULL_33_12]|uniref:CBU-0592-like domain-containing protein n=1 Tax=Candidatus Nomurabacteria bacterium RIFCSPLOWO2_01_FULL_33_17 TaxID=1801764 RepID=A0A1F6WQW8_9BACT|nr:MAG: hypothetical protein A3C57_00685 [Candidatus Nomurabacteria bacterium RIFCSPHIGHO2_02_FULL_33_12]OGI84250.1 MAG: hypothetical protein A2903_00025 [Candidatus Nomurabacteria bacterium RIFCSPLOWO2_01_FULL_33_17]
MNYIKIIGWAGTLLLMVTYMLNVFGVISADSLSYLIPNLLAGVFLGIRVLKDKNYSNVFLEIFWITVTLIAIFRYFL